MADVVGAQTIIEKILPVTLSLLNDPIPNIRFNVAKALERMIPSLKVANRQTIEAHIKPALEKLATDMDQDVRYFAQRALHRACDPCSPLPGMTVWACISRTGSARLRCRGAWPEAAAEI